MTFNYKTNSPKKSLEESIIEMKLMREGKMKKVTWVEFKKTLETNN